MEKRPRKSNFSPDPESVWYGFQRVSPEVKTARVRRVFESVAPRYDLMNDLMSGGIHRLWKRKFVDKISPKPGQIILDVAGGTGDIARACLARCQQAKVIICDINPAMMEAGMTDSNSFAEQSLQWVAGDASALPIADNSIDVVSIAFGLRNVTRIDTALAEFHRVLRPGGRFLCLEFNPDVASLVRPLYRFWCAKVLPFLGAVIAHDAEAYRYLAESIRQFPPPPMLGHRMRKVGFSNVKWHRMTCGIAVIHQGWRE